MRDYLVYRVRRAIYPSVRNKAPQDEHTSKIKFGIVRLCENFMSNLFLVQLETRIQTALMGQHGFMVFPRSMDAGKRQILW